MQEIGIMDVGGFQVGHAQDLEGATGCTVILCDRMSPAGLDVRGGGPASRESQILNPVAAAEGINAGTAVRWQRLWSGCRRRSPAVSGGARHRL